MATSSVCGVVLLLSTAVVRSPSSVCGFVASGRCLFSADGAAGGALASTTAASTLCSFPSLVGGELAGSWDSALAATAGDSAASLSVAVVFSVACDSLVSVGLGSRKRAVTSSVSDISVFFSGVSGALVGGGSVCGRDRGVSLSTAASIEAGGGGFSGVATDGEGERGASSLFVGA